MLFSYNILNLPCGVTSVSSGSLTYTYLSDGTKVSALKSDGSGKRYVGSMVYSVPESDGGSETLESAAWDEGRIFFDVEEAVDSTGNGLVVVDSIPGIGCYRDFWYVTDHLGNVRSVVDISTSLAAPQVVERNDYLPYGTRLGVGNTVLESNHYRLGGKEEQVFGSLDLGKVDFGVRQYDPFIAGWTTIDPMAAKYGSMSPYSYCAGNPVNIVDPDGNDNYQVDSYGYVSLIEKTDDDFDRLYAHYAEIGPNVSFLVEDRTLLPSLAATGLKKTIMGKIHLLHHRTISLLSQVYLNLWLIIPKLNGLSTKLIIIIL